VLSPELLIVFSMPAPASEIALVVAMMFSTG
jgi:hypothetical protein